MIKFKFLTFFILFNLSFLFIKIYQHNKSVQLNYDRQKLENRRTELTKEKDKLLVKLSKIKNPKQIKKLAQKKLGLRPVKLAQIINYPEQGAKSKEIEKAL